MSEAGSHAPGSKEFNSGVSEITNITAEELDSPIFDDATPSSVNSSTGTPSDNLFEDWVVPPVIVDGASEGLDSPFGEGEGAHQSVTGEEFNPFENTPEIDSLANSDDTPEGISPTDDSENEPAEEVGPSRTDRFYEKLGAMMPPEGSIKRGLKNFMQTAGVGVAAYFANKYGDDVLGGIVDAAEWLAREGADLAVSIGSAAWEGAQIVAGAVKDIASNANPVYFGAGVANGVMRGAIDSDPANDNKKNLITGAVMGTALAHGANPGAPEAVSFAAGHLVGSKGRKLVSAAGRAASGAATKFNARRLSDSSIKPEEDRVAIATNEAVVPGPVIEQDVIVPAVDTTPPQPTQSGREVRKANRAARKAARKAAIARGKANKKDGAQPSEEIRALADSV